jgi:CheY-like chemotaxis protein
MTKILLADDSKFLRLTVERALSRAGYSVIVATDGEEAVKLARERKPDLMLLDMLLPKMAGPDVLKALKNDPATQQIPIIVFTGLSQKNAARLQKDGAYAFLEKAEFGLEKGCDPFLQALAGIVQKLGLAETAEMPKVTSAGS